MSKHQIGQAMLVAAVLVLAYRAGKQIYDRPKGQAFTQDDALQFLPIALLVGGAVILRKTISPV